MISRLDQNRFKKHKQMVIKLNGREQLNKNKFKQYLMMG